LAAIIAVLSITAGGGVDLLRTSTLDALLRDLCPFLWSVILGLSKSEGNSTMAGESGVAGPVKGSFDNAALSE
jgi:hypothetical protein